MSDGQPQADEAVIACLLSEREQAMRGEALARELFSHVEEVDELADGYAFRFPPEEDWGDKLLEFVAAERRCCPFFTFALVFEPNHGPVWLHLRGSPAIKAFVRDRFVRDGEAAAAARP